MKPFFVLTAALLSLAVNATPVPEGSTSARGRVHRVADTRAILERDAAAENVGLAKRAELVCEIVHVVTVVDCHFWPTHASTWQGMDNWVVTSFAGSTSHDFNCYKNGETVGGITAWDYANNWDCFVPGYYTDSHCTHQALGACSF